MEDDAVRETVNSYRSLSGELENHSVLIKDKTMIQFLAYSLTSPDVEVVQLSLETLENLLQTERNGTVLQSIFGVIEALKATSEREDLSESLCQQADRLHSTLISTKNALFTPEHTPFKTPTATPTATPQGVLSVNRRKLVTMTTTFQVQGLYPETRQELESVVVKIRGVVSVVVDVDSQRCVVRALKSVRPQMIAELIAEKTDMVPRLVLRNKNNQEFLKNILDQELDETSESLPPYLEEGYSEPERDSAVLSFQTLKTNASSWLNAATSFLQNSLYW